MLRSDRLRRPAEPRRPAPSGTGILRELTPDVVVFDETFVNRDVPFAAFTARRSHYDHWNRPGKTTFHSTTYQPNTISSLHFLRCLDREDAEFYRSIGAELEKVRTDPAVRRSLFRRLYSPSLVKTIALRRLRHAGRPRCRGLRPRRRAGHL